VRGAHILVLGVLALAAPGLLKPKPADAGLAAATSAGGDRASQFKVAIDAVRVDVLVTDGSQPVAGLDIDDFELRDGGVPQQLSAVFLEEVPLSVMLLLDTSTSVKGQPLEHLKAAAAAVPGLLKPADNAALMTFSGGVRLESAWTGDHRRLVQAIEQTTAGGGTSLHDAAYAGLTLRDERPGRTLLLVFSDGADTASWLPGEHVIDIARRNDAVVYAVTLGEPATRHGYRLDFRSGIQAPVSVPDWRSLGRSTMMELREQFLDVLAAETGGKILNATRSDRLRETFEAVVSEFRSRYLITYTPRGVEAGGWHPIDVRLKRRGGKVTARRGYLR
jgi:VWFA-related protein